jgi:hypothetical protein
MRVSRTRAALAGAIISYRAVRPGRFELPRSKRTTRPSNLARDLPVLSYCCRIANSIRDKNDLDFMDSMAVVTVLSRAGLVGAQQA